MDIYEYLKLDHKHVSELFTQFDNAPSTIRKHQIAAMIVRELSVHADSEEATFYHVLEKFELSHDDVKHGEKEHREIKNQINKILDSEVGSSLDKKIEKLKALVEHHVKEEEGTIFKKAKKVISQEEAFEIKEQMHYLKQQLLREFDKTRKRRG